MRCDPNKKDIISFLKKLLFYSRKNRNTSILHMYVNKIIMFQNGETSLHAAALFGHMKVTRILMQYGADRTLKNKVNIDKVFIDAVWS